MFIMAYDSIVRQISHCVREKKANRNEGNEIEEQQSDDL